MENTESQPTHVQERDRIIEIPGPSTEVVVAGEEIVEVDEDDLQHVEVVEGEEIIYDGDYIEYADVPSGRNLLFEMYQPLELSNGAYQCKICLRAGKDAQFQDRATFVAHRYKCHGSFNNNVICPMEDCNDVYATLSTLRRHLTQHHQLPLEIHQQSFENIGEFEKYRHLLEITTGCQYMMHTKQPKYRRQVMHCAKSEHKLVLQTQKHRLPKERMHKSHSACPSVISYRIDLNNGQVHAFMQLYHVGHNPDSDAYIAGNSIRPMDICFPMKPSCFAGHPMQYVQIDVHEMPTAVYGDKIYESILVVTCIKSKFMWARALQDSTRTAIGRILNSIFNEYGVPEGFSTLFSPTYIRDTMKSLESVYAVEIREIWSEPPPYSSLEQWTIEMAQQELQCRNRWVEQLQFVVMEYNQKMLPSYDETPFQRMFQRRPPNLYGGENYVDLEEEDPESVPGKIRKYHEDLRKESVDMANALAYRFSYGDKVFLRKGVTKPRRGNNTQYFFGFIGEVNLKDKYYPYKVHYSPTDEPWPSDRNIFAWVSVFDILPTSHQIREMAYEERQQSIASLLCHCSGNLSNVRYDTSAIGDSARKASKCVLFRNLMCNNQMSRHCCKAEGRMTCRFHRLYPENDESYARMEMALVAYNRQNRLVEEKVARDLEDDGPTVKMVVEEMERRRKAGEHFSREEILEEVGVQLMDDKEYENQQEQEQEEEEEEEGEVVGEIVEVVEEGEEGGDGDKTLEHIEVTEYVERPASPQTFQNAEQAVEEPKNDQPPPVKRSRKPKKEEGEEPKRRKIEEEEVSDSSAAAARRASGRRSVRPKVLNDYVE